MLLYLHGGGYTLGSPTAYAQLAAGLARSAGTACFSVDYRLAPEAPYPAGIDDAVAAYRGLLAEHAPESILVGGDSAGGGLTLALLLTLLHEGLPMPAGAVLLSPWTDLTFTGASMRTKAEDDPTLTEEGLRVAAAHYAGDTPPNGPRISPVFADLTGLPPLLIEVGEAEILLSDSTRVAANAAEAAVDVTLHAWPGMIHDWPAFSFALSEGREAIAEVGTWARARLDAAAVATDGAPGQGASGAEGGEA
ncbi:alpha/beta hydrolase [Brevibacterium litoralis]|uniref:alpha/beta hydrolase n=1 Tax=Brevibacterium litoralis TaxID=3138935 RepID=UPI0032EAE2B9